MPTYVLLIKWTDQGIKAVKDAPKRAEAGIKAFEALGGKMHGVYLVMGEYDYVAVGEAPSDEVATAFSLGLSSLGNSRTTTLRAYTIPEFAAIVKKLP